MAPRGRSPRVDIKSSSQVPRAAKESEAALTRLQKRSKESFGHLTKHALGYGAALVGGAGVVGGLEATVEASVAAEKSQAALQAQLKAVGISYKAHSKEIDDVVSKTSSYSGFLDKDLTGALANIVRSTGSLGKSYKLLGLATDVARAKNIDVASAGQMVGRVYAGNVRVLKSLGIQMDPVTKAQDKLKASTKNATEEQKRAAIAADKSATSQKALGLLQQRLGGQAKAFGDTTAGSMEKFKASVDHLEVKLGNALAPTIKSVADKAARFVSQMQTGTGAGGHFAHQMGEVAHKVGQVAGVAKDVAGWLGKHPALLKVAGAAWVVYKTAALVNIATVKAAELGLFGPSMRAKMVAEAGATGAASGRALGGAGALASARASGRLLGAAALAGVIFYLQQHSGDTRPIWDRILNPVGPGAGSNPHHLKSYTPPKGAPPYKPDSGPLRLQDTTPHGAPPPRAPHVHAHKTGVTAHASRAATAVGGGRARASSGSVTGDTAGLNADFLNRLRAMSAGTGHAIFVKSGFRTAAEQQALVNEKGVWSPSNPTGAAPVGSSMHEKGLAADISPDSGTFGGVCAKYGLSFPVPGEPWHCQPTGTAASTAPSSAGPTHSAARRRPAAPKIPVYNAPLLGNDPTLRIHGVPVGTGNAAGPGIGVTGALAQNDVDRAAADATPDVKDDVAVIVARNGIIAKRIKQIRRRVKQIHKLLKIRTLSTSSRSRLRKELAALNSELADLMGQVNSNTGELTGLGYDASGQPIPGTTYDANGQAVPADTAPSAYDVVEGQISDIGLHEHAGDYGSDPDAAHKTAVTNDIAAIDAALANPVGLSDEDILQLRAQRGDLVAELKGLTDNTAELAAQMKDLAAAINEQNQFAKSVSAVSLGTAWKALADVISGQIFGLTSGRAQTAGAGDITRY